MAIENNKENYHSNSYDTKTNDNLKMAVKSCLSMLKNGKGLYNHFGKLTAYDVYEINSYFENEVINNCWNENMNFIRENNYKNGFLNKFSVYDEYVEKIVNDTNYVKYELLNNSSVHYNSLNIDVRNNLQSEYELVQNNYLSFSKIILSISNFLVKGDVYE